MSNSQVYEYQNELDLTATQAYEREHDVDQPLPAASQDFKDDKMLLAASQGFGMETASLPGPSKTDYLPFRAPRSCVDTEDSKDLGVPKKNKANMHF